MPLNFLSRKSPANTQISTEVARHLAPRTESCARELAAVYRVRRPSVELVNALKFELSWEVLDEEGRFRVQQYLGNLVARSGGQAAKYPFLSAIQADFAVEVKTSEHFRYLDHLAAQAPGLEDKLEAERARNHVLHDRNRALRGQVEAVVSERDALQNNYTAAMRRNKALTDKLQRFRTSTAELYAALPEEVLPEAAYARSAFSTQAVEEAKGGAGSSLRRGTSDAMGEGSIH